MSTAQEREQHRMEERMKARAWVAGLPDGERNRLERDFAEGEALARSLSSRKQS